MNTYAQNTKESKSQPLINPAPQKQNSIQFADKSSEAIVQSKLQELANKSAQVSQLMAFQEMANSGQNIISSLGANVIQARFDDEDLNKMRQVAQGDDTLTNILDEVLAIHNRMPDDINYGVSTKGGHAALNDGGTGQVVVKDERWALTKKIKNFFNAYGMEHDVERQSMIIHELTHLAELYTNLPSDAHGVVAEEHRPESDKALAEAMEPDPNLVDAVYAQKGEVEELLAQSDYDDKMKAYLRGRLEYGFAINAENPTVFTEISYYLKAKGKNGTPFYDRISGFADQFYRSRLERQAAREADH